MTPAFSAAGADLAQGVAHVVHLRLGLQRALAEEREQDDLHPEGLRDGDGVGDPALAERIVLEVVPVQDLEAQRGQRDPDALGLGEVGLLQAGSLSGRRSVPPCRC